MNFLVFIKRNRLLLTVVIALALILGTLGIIYTLENPSKNSEVSAGNDLKGYAIAKEKINPLLSLPTMPPEVKNRIVKYLNVLEDKNKSKQERYDAAVRAYDYLSTSYSLTSEDKIALVLKDFSAFVKNNFPSLFKEKDFVFFCQDPSCAEEAQPAGLLVVIDEIKQSDFPDQLKKSTIQNLLTTGYLPKKNVDQRFNEYLFMELNIRTYSNFSKTGANIKIADELYSFIEDTYPEQLRTSRDPNSTQTGILKQKDLQQ